MKIHFLVVGKTNGTYFNEAIANYQNRLKYYITFDMEVIPELKNAKNLSFEQQKEKEADLIIKSLQPGDHVVLLDEKGREFTSMQFSSYKIGRAHV